MGDEYIIDCPHCFNKTVFKNVVVQEIDENHGVFLCETCKIPIIVKFYPKDQFSFSLGEALFYFGPRAIYYTIPSANLPIPQGLPENIVKALVEALDSFRREKMLSASGMFRRTLEAALNSLGASRRDTLARRIRSLLESNQISETIANWADKVRLLGNLGAHDSSEDPTYEEVNEVREFLDVFLRYTFELQYKLDQG